jgi:bla regulator protein blaR1
MLPAFIDHLWQSSLFVVLAWALSALLRSHGAHLRYRIWWVASLKFLVPFSLLALIGDRFRGSVVDAPMLAPLSSVQQAVAPFVAPANFISPSPSPAANLVLWVCMFAWVAGFLFVVIRWLARWSELKAIVRSAVPGSVSAAIPVLSSSSLHEPGVVGIRRPVLLLSEQLVAQLDRRQLEAIVEHELWHVRRRDNLTMAIHMSVEALFWFHPLVWWIGARLRQERERACDEAVVRSGHRARSYAEGILRVCRHCVASKLSCVSGVSGADLETRLEAIMKNETVVGLSRVKALLLGATALAIVTTPVVVGLTFPSDALAQAPATKAASTGVTPVGKIQLIDGKRVRLKYQNADVRELLKAIADAAQVNILVSDKVGGTVTVDLADMPWERALSIVLNAKGLSKQEKDGIIYVDLAAKA